MAMTLEFDEVRRLTGPNLYWDKPGAVVDILVTNASCDDIANRWHHWARGCLDNLGWTTEQTTHRTHDLGVSLVISAPVDSLYTACDIAELAWECCAAEFEKRDLPVWQRQLDIIRESWHEERNPALMTLIEAATHRGLTSLIDDDNVTIGSGQRLQSWPLVELPDPDKVSWSSLADVPMAFITGTNGKSTSVRLAAEIARNAGLVAGVTSTDFIKVGDKIVDTGDYSGPAGARMVLRDDRCEIAFLEVARGGLLRRGLPVTKVDAALITNVASDHLGQYGINTIEELAQVKFMVSHAVACDGTLVLNADDRLSVAQSKHVGVPICWFSTDPENTRVQRAIRAKGMAVFTHDNQFIVHHDGKSETLLSVDDAPMTFTGSALHNIQNALGVIGLCKAMGISSASIVAGLKRFGSDEQDNPGRGNRYDIGGITVIVDFAHNEHSVRAMVDMLAQMTTGNRIIMFGHAGDRRDQDIRDLTNAVANADASHYIVSELENYLRGRSLGDVPDLVRTTLQQRGVMEQQITLVENPFAGAQHALSLARPGDTVLLLTLDQRTKVQDWLSQRQQSG